MGLIDKLGDRIDSAFDNFNSKRRLNSNLLPSKIAFVIKSIILFCFLTCIYTFTRSGIEFINGDFPVYKEVSDGAICNDGWRSNSYGPGTCSWHSGVKYYLYRKVLMGMHIANPRPYLNIALISFVILIFPSFFLKGYRWTVLGYTISFLYYTGFIIKIITLFFIQMTYLPFVLYTNIFLSATKGKNGKKI
jgi:hypothetical protein